MSWRDDLPPIPGERIRDEVMVEGARRVRRRRLVGSSLTVLLLLIVGITAIALQNRGPKPASVATNGTTTTALEGTTTTASPATTSTALPTAGGPCPVATGTRGRILFFQRKNGGTPWDLFSENPDGTCKTQLTHYDGTGSALNFGGSWSPDGKRIAFVRDGAGLMVMNADGSGERLLLAAKGTTQSDAAWTSWSPDGRRIAFAGRTDGLWVVDSASGKASDVATGQSDSPSWSPDGARIAFGLGGVVGAYDIVSVRPDGSDRKVLGPGDRPIWGPDGRIVFASNTGAVAIMRADGSGVREILPHASLVPAAWSPDGKRIAGNGPGGIVLMNDDGTNRTVLPESEDGIASSW